MARTALNHGTTRETRLPAEAIEQTIDVLVIERQKLREQHVGPELLEQNRRALAYWQHELAEARRQRTGRNGA